MEILFMVFMIVVSIMALFAVIVVLRDIVQEIAASRKNRDKQNADIIAYAERIIAEAEAREAASVIAKAASSAEPAAEEAAETENVVNKAVATVADVEENSDTEPVATEETASEKTAIIAEAAEEATDSESTISFSTSQQTLEEKYLALAPEQRRWYDEIIKYASAIEGSKRFKNARYEEYKVGKNRLVRLLIKRGIIHCEFILQNSDFKNFVNENKLSVRQSATTMLVDSSATVDAVKNSIDIVVAALAEEKEYKKKLARERRRARGASVKTAEASETTTETPANV